MLLFKACQLRLDTKMTYFIGQKRSETKVTLCDTQHKDIQHNDTQHDDIQHNDNQHKG
jgi:hypothetical protein